MNAPQNNNPQVLHPNYNGGLLRGIPLTKLLLVAVLAGLALCLQVTVFTLQVLVEERQVLQQQQQRQQQQQQQQQNSNNKEAVQPSTLQSMETTQAATLYTVQQGPADTGTSPVTAGKAWAHTLLVQQWLRTWDPNYAATTIQPLHDDTTLPAQYARNTKRQARDTGDTGYYHPTSWYVAPLQTPEEQLQYNNNDNDNKPKKFNASALVDALTTAARQGHAQAQFHTANALAAGFWPVKGVTTTTSSSTTTSLLSQLTVQESWTVPTSAQQQLAWLYWRLAAQQGHVEAAMALAHRLETTFPTNAKSSSSSSSKLQQQQCRQALPVWQAAASGIMDQLEADTASRAKILPATDGHELYLVHLHGSSAVQLSGPNRADESTDALQFYHLRAVNLYGSDAAAQAAYTLGQYYHHGLRGVPQNITKAAEYYAMAADQNHWEAAGAVGKLYLYGIGVPQDAYQAHKFFQKGIPSGLKDCQARYTRLAKGKKKDASHESIALCEANCLNGMAMIKILGLPHVTGIDWEQAEAFLELAKDQGSTEAMYNLAMFRMGWHQHWKFAQDVAENGQTTVDETTVFPHNKNAQPVHHPSQNEYTTALADLRLAASKGHLQANMRAGLLYSRGVTIPKPTGGGEIHVVLADCEKATKYFKWVVDHASPDRARRMRTAYQQYLAGDTEDALRNYLVAAATGSETAQLNAAFLMEKGTCPGLSNPVDCAKAAVRLYKAAAERGQGEACLRVGDFYYYGKLREQRSPMGPFGWTRYIVFPEELVPLVLPWWKAAVEWVVDQVQFYTGYDLGADTDTTDEENDDDHTTTEQEAVCDASDPEAQRTCAVSTTQEETSEHSVEGDLSMAAHYYELAVSSRESARAHFNLGFLFEWGLGVKQDFPLAKRHYDLSMASHTRESDLPAVIALFTLSLHERIIKLWSSLERWIESELETAGKGHSEGEQKTNWPSPGPSHQEGSPQPLKRRKREIIVKHIFSWDTLLILILTVLFLLLIGCGRTR